MSSSWLRFQTQAAWRTNQNLSYNSPTENVQSTVLVELDRFGVDYEKAFRRIQSDLRNHHQSTAILLTHRNSEPITLITNCHFTLSLHTNEIQQHLAMTNISAVTYPRTGKRGVPQQFPRRLYEMLESEARNAASSPQEKVVISWSESGKAFRIFDVDSFMASVLPKYFRTKKFSSFQRNLNLVGRFSIGFNLHRVDGFSCIFSFGSQYGFAKVRRGPDTDMYAHPCFVRGCPESLSQLRKSTTSSRRRLAQQPSTDESDGSTSDDSLVRSITPSPTRNISARIHHQSRIQELTASRPRYLNSAWLTLCAPSIPPQSTHTPVSFMPAPKTDGSGRLDLLALAIEREQRRVNPL